MSYPTVAKWLARPAVSVALRYGLATFSVAAAIGLSAAWQRFDSPLPFTGFALSAIAVTFWIGRTKPGILAVLFATLARSYFFQPATTVVARMLYESVFIWFALLMIWITRSRDELEAKVAERTKDVIAANEKLKIEIVQRKLAEEAVILARDRFRLVLDTTPAQLHSARPDGYLDYFNQRWLEYVGLSLEDMQGWGWTAVIHPEDLEEILEKWRVALASGKSFEHESRMRGADGEYRWQFFRKVPLRDEGGNIVKWYGSSIDIEDRKRAEEGLRHLSGRLLRSQDEERRRIARELHDSTGQNLVALATALGRLRTSIPSIGEQSQRLLSECEALAEQCIREVRTLSYVLHPPVLDDAGLEDAIRDYVKGFTKRSGIQVELDLSPRLERMTREMEIALFRVVQEGLTNIQRHSGSKQAKIRIEYGSNLVLEISDLGHGISVSRLRMEEERKFETGVGVPSMQERVKLVGGRLEIDSTSHGTTVRVTIPLGEEHEKTSHSDRG